MRHKHKRTKEQLIAKPMGRKKGSAFRRVVAAASDGKREYYLHSTKGYRSHTV